MYGMVLTENFFGDGGGGGRRKKFWKGARDTKYA